MAVHPASSGNPALDVIDRGFMAGGARVVPFPEVVPDRGIVLLHWSEALWLDPRRAHRGLAREEAADPGVRRREQFVRALSAARRRGVPVVWIRHNTVPSAWGGSVQGWDERLGDLVRHLDAIVHLHPESRRMDRGRPWEHLPSAVVPHPRYDRPLGSVPRPRSGATVDRAAIIGGIEERKNHRRIVGAALAAGLRVTVAGKANDPWLVRRLHLRRLTARGRLALDVGYVSDRELDRLMARSPAVLLDQADQRNSGVVWFALSRGAVVIGVDSPAIRAGRDVVGPDWVRVLPAMDAALLRAAVERPVPTGLPDLGGLVSGAEFAARIRRLADEVPARREVGGSL